MKRVLAIYSMLFLIVSGIAAQQKVTIVVDGFKNLDGKLMVGVYDSDSTFLKKAFKGYAIDVIDTELEFSIELPNGVYAISVYQDENRNGKLDTGIFGIPLEKYGFSNNVKGFMGPPSFEKAKFSLSNDIVIRINLI